MMNCKQILIVLCVVNSVFVNGGYAQERPEEGFTEPLKTVFVAAAESGVIQSISVREGQSVKRDDVICQLDTQVLEASLQVARAKFESQGKIDGAQATLADKQHHLEQMKQLFGGEHASEKEVRLARLAVELARASLRSAHDEKRISEMEIERIKAQIQRRVIRAPTHGVVLELPLREGEAITTGERHIATIACLDQLRVRYFLSTEQALKMKRGDSVQVQFPTTHQRASAVVDFVSPVTDSNSGTVRVELLIDNRRGQFRSGLRCLLTESTAAISSGLRTASNRAR